LHLDLRGRDGGTARPDDAADLRDRLRAERERRDPCRPVDAEYVMQADLVRDNEDGGSTGGAPGLGRPTDADRRAARDAPRRSDLQCECFQVLLAYGREEVGLVVEELRAAQ